ncbi:hypothetical protein [Kribbella catacumbae]|uniref:hypothetical protein n=1 Tax=Kribbella catacumbae TaxID=460086 RepID=UPI0003A04DA1|nr:hypothetical protein [Kribbella catacumbae]
MPWPSPLTSDSAGQAIFSDTIDKRVTVDGDVLGSAAADAKIATDAAAYLKGTGPDAAFVYFGDVDIACPHLRRDRRLLPDGHREHRPPHRHSARRHQVPADVRPRGLDVHLHHRPRPHRCWRARRQHPQERAPFIIQYGPGIAPTTPAIQPKNVDIATAVLAHFGVAIDPAWGLDGEVLGAESDDLFDSAPRRRRRRSGDRDSPGSPYVT